MDSIKDTLGEFAAGLFENICKNLYDGLYPHCSNIFDKIFVTLNARVGDTSGMLGQSIEGWNSGAFNIVKAAAENVCIPIAGAVIAFVFAWELARMAQENNLMQSVGPDRLIMTLVKLAVCLLVCIRSFDIVIYIYSIGNWAVKKLNNSTATFGSGLTLDDVVPVSPPIYDSGVVFQLLGVFFALCLCYLICQASSVLIYFQVLSWFLDMAVFASAAPIPFATFLNRDWGQTGMNYGKKVFSLGLKGFFMMLFICIYGGIMNNLPGSSFMEVMTMLCGGGVAITIALWKAGSIADSILNAH